MADAHAKPHHDYHLVDPSPWPIVGSVSAFVTAVGAITWMHHMFAAAPFIFGVGVIGMLYTCSSAGGATLPAKPLTRATTRRVVQISHRYGMILFIASEVMFFVAWFWAYFNTALFPADVHQVVRDQFLGGAVAAEGDRDLRSVASAAAQHADSAHLRNDGDLGASCVAGERPPGPEMGPDPAPFVLGLAFTACRRYEYSHAAFHYSGNIYGATFFMATGFHGAHVIIGSTFLIVCLIRAYLGHFTPTQHLGFEFAAWYWHFVDVVWLFLFACIYVWGAGAARRTRTDGRPLIDRGRLGRLFCLVGAAA